MNILAGLPIGAKIVGGIVTAATAVAVPTVIIINNNVNSVPETPQSSVIQQTKPERPTEGVTVKEESKAITEPSKIESVAPAKTEQPAPQSVPQPALAPAPTREELFARAVAEFKTTGVFGNGKGSGKDFLDRMRSSYLSIINQGETDEKWAKRRLESLYPVYPMPTWLPLSMQFAKILQKHGLIDANLAEENFTIQARNVAYPYLIDLAISGNY